MHAFDQLHCVFFSISSLPIAENKFKEPKKEKKKKRALLVACYIDAS